MKKTGVDYAPLLLGKVQLGNAHNTQRELMIEELFLRNIIVDPKETITNHPNCNDYKNKKFFLPKLLAATDWTKDVIADTLLKIKAIRDERARSISAISDTIG